MFVPVKRRIATLLKMMDGRLNGKVEFQKIVFILQNEGVDFKMMYSYNVYGPFSEDLQIELELMSRSNGMLEKMDLNDKNKPFSTVYTLTSSGEAVNNDTLVEEKRDLIQYLKNLKREELELISSIYYFKNLNYTDAMIQSKVATLKENIFDEFFMQANDKYKFIQNRFSNSTPIEA
jgi:uncharacterized protein